MDLLQSKTLSLNEQEYFLNCRKFVGDDKEKFSDDEFNPSHFLAGILAKNVDR